jgi:hypothetical protein
VPRKERTTRPAADQLDLSTLLGESPRIWLTEEDAQAALAFSSSRLSADLVDAEAALWDDSPYAWVRLLPTARKSKAAERLVAAALSTQGLTPSRPSSAKYDFSFRGERYKVRMSMRWASGDYTFQNVSSGPGDYDVLLLLGVSPQQVHLWVLEPRTAAQHVSEKTGWLSFPSDHVPEWLGGHGGSLVDAAELIDGRQRPSSA